MLDCAVILGLALAVAEQRALFVRGGGRLRAGVDRSRHRTVVAAMEFSSAVELACLKVID